MNRLVLLLIVLALAACSHGSQKVQAPVESSVVPVESSVGPGESSVGSGESSLDAVENSVDPYELFELSTDETLAAPRTDYTKPPFHCAAIPGCHMMCNTLLAGGAVITSEAGCGALSAATAGACLGTGLLGPEAIVACEVTAPQAVYIACVTAVAFGGCFTTDICYENVCDVTTVIPDNYQASNKCEDVDAADNCCGTLTNPIPSGEGWVRTRYQYKTGCGSVPFLQLGHCDRCCKPEPKSDMMLTNVHDDNSNGCEGICGEYNGNERCACDTYCTDNGDCCSNYQEECTGTDVGFSDTSLGQRSSCICDEYCTYYNDCCPNCHYSNDYEDKDTIDSCCFQISVLNSVYPESDSVIYSNCKTNNSKGCSVMCADYALDSELFNKCMDVCRTECITLSNTNKYGSCSCGPSLSSALTTCTVLSRTCKNGNYCKCDGGGIVCRGWCTPNNELQSTVQNTKYTVYLGRNTMIVGIFVGSMIFIVVLTLFYCKNKRCHNADGDEVDHIDMDNIGRNDLEENLVTN